jgi:hypothetical protein
MPAGASRIAKSLARHFVVLPTMHLACVERPTWPFSAATCRRIFAAAARTE